MLTISSDKERVEINIAAFTVAAQKAKYVTRVVNRLSKEKSTSEPFHFKNQGSLAYLGNW